MKWIVSLSLLISSLAWADGHSVNNGGGVICINGKCKTLVEAGLEVKPEFQGVWLPEEEVLSLVRGILSNMPLDDQITQKLSQQVLGRLNQFRLATVVDPQKLEAIKQQYIKLATDAGFPIDPKTFELVAFSSDDTIQPAMTYVLPKFMELSTVQQAYLLVHEGLYRGQPTNRLRYILQLENAIQNECTLEKKLNAHFASYHLGILSKAELLGHILFAAGNFEASRPYCAGLDSPIAPVLLGDVKVAEDLQTIRLEFDWQRMLDLGQKDSRIPYIFSKMDSFEFKATKQIPDSGRMRNYLSLEKKVFNINVYHKGYFITAEIVDPDSLPLLLPD